MKELYIHIGTPKTGTSTIQHFLENNRELLLRKGVYYPKGIPYNKWGGNESTAGNFAWVTRIEKSDEELKNILVNMFLIADKVLLSTEHIWGEVNNKIDFFNNIKLLLADMEVEIKVIVYLRKQVDYLESQYRECVRLVLMKETLLEVFNLDNPILWLVKKNLNYLSVIDDIAYVVGEKNVLVRPYEDCQFKNGNIIDDFMFLLNINVNEEFILPVKNYNPSINNAALEMKRCMNTSSLATRDEMDELSYEILMVDGIEKNNKHFRSLLSHQQRCDFMENYNLCNKEVAFKYLNKTDGILFEEEDAEYSTGSMVKTDELLEQTISFFTSINIEMNRKYKSLLKKNENIQDDMSNLNALVRELQEIQVRQNEMYVKEKSEFLTQLDEKQKELSWMKNSRSWKITAPVRYVFELIRKCLVWKV